MCINSNNHDFSAEDIVAQGGSCHLMIMAFTLKPLKSHLHAKYDVIMNQRIKFHYQVAKQQTEMLQNKCGALHSNRRCHRLFLTGLGAAIGGAEETSLAWSSS